MRFCSPLLFAAGLLSAPLLFAQTPTPAVTAATVTTATAATAVANGDAILATWLHAACSNEIALAAIAVKQAKHDDVRAFAQAIVDKHTAFAAKLQPFATGAEAQPKPNDGKRSTEASVGRVTTMVPFDHAGLIRELAAKCLASESKLLAGKPAGEFDQCFVTMQLAAHGKGVDTLAVFRSRATPALAAVIDEGTKLYAAHHEQALGLQTKLAAPVVEARGGR